MAKRWLARYEMEVDQGAGSAKTVQPVGAFGANERGLLDMAGNLWEWTEDCYAETYAGAPADGSARTSESCTRRVARGGAWDVRAREARSANRNPRNATDRNYTIGFRVARDL